MNAATRQRRRHAATTATHGHEQRQHGDVADQRAGEREPVEQVGAVRRERVRQLLVRAADARHGQDDVHEQQADARSWPPRAGEVAGDQDDAKTAAGRSGP